MADPDPSPPTGQAHGAGRLAQAGTRHGPRPRREAVKWKKPTKPAGVPVWSRGGIICTGETYRGKVKLTFARGALLPDPAGLFNGSLGGNTMRAIDITEGREIDEDAFTALVRAAIAHNEGK
jgi:hypothetical protein